MSKQAKDMWMMALRGAVFGIVVGCVVPTARAQNVVNYREMPDPLLFLLREPVVHDELKLSDQQRQALIKLNESHDSVLLSTRNRPPNEAQPAVQKVFEQTRVKLRALLTAEQQQRLAQIGHRVRGISFVVQPEVAAQLKLSTAQADRLASVLESTDQQLVKLRSQLQAGELSADHANQQNTELQQQQQRDVLAVLTDDQRQQLLTLIGPPFDLSKLGHVSFKAPELLGSGPWINSQPLNLSKLQGRVVAVHFWAFQCINCIHNFPWYQQWQRDYADKGLVIVGVHTPEVTRERDVQLLRDVVEKQQFAFPVVVDNDHRTWNEWGNSMWPAVYLIDKQGKLRYWWYGELNWQGAGGQRIMAEKIEQLLAED